MAKEKQRSKKFTGHWEKDMHDVKNTVNNTAMGASFNPQPPSKRVKMYEKINECDY
jgi:hypothetical protein